jgi:hypothetical protein
LRRNEYDDPRQHRSAREPVTEVDLARLEATELAWREDVSDRLRSLTTASLSSASRTVAALTTKLAAVGRLQRDVQQLQRRVDALERQPPALSPTATP